MSKNQVDLCEKRMKQLADPKYLGVDCYSIYQSISALAASRLRAMADHPYGYPCAKGMTCKKWKKKLDKMATAFELLLEDDYEVIAKRQKEIDKGLKLFSQWFQSLWT